MKHHKNSLIGKIFIAIGFSLLVLSVFTALIWQWRIHAVTQQATAYANELQRLIPEPQSAVPEERRDNTMPVLSLDQTDFIGLLEMPMYHSVLPVCAAWNKPSKYPCRLSGSVYDGTLQIGATSQRGQFDFYRDISVGDSLFFTDVEGNRYPYSVIDIRYEKHANQEALQRTDAALTLFIKNIYGFDYIILSCDTPS